MGDYSSLVGGVLIVAGIVGAAVMALLIYGVPWLWALLKPLLHAVTA